MKDFFIGAWCKVHNFLLRKGIIKNDCDDYVECGCGNPDEHCMFCLLPKRLHINPKDETYQDLINECFEQRG